MSCRQANRAATLFLALAGFANLPASCWAAETTSAASAPPAGLLDTLARFLTEDDEANATRVETMSRDPGTHALAMPLLTSGGRQTVLAGDRTFHLTWIGGKPPFKIELTGPSGPLSITWTQTGDRGVSAAMRLDEGPYEVRLTDAKARSVRGAFGATAQPPAVDERGVAQLPPDLGHALLAARLSDLDDGAWRLEAYERLSDSPSDPTSRVLAHRLASGLSLSELRMAGAGHAE